MVFCQEKFCSTETEGCLVVLARRAGRRILFFSGRRSAAEQRIGFADEPVLWSGLMVSETATETETEREGGGGDAREFCWSSFLFFWFVKQRRRQRQKGGSKKTEKEGGLVLAQCAGRRFLLSGDAEAPLEKKNWFCRRTGTGSGWWVCACLVVTRRGGCCKRESQNRRKTHNIVREGPAQRAGLGGKVRFWESGFGNQV